MYSCIVYKQRKNSIIITIIFFKTNFYLFKQAQKKAELFVATPKEDLLPPENAIDNIPACVFVPQLGALPEDIFESNDEVVVCICLIFVLKGNV